MCTKTNIGWPNVEHTNKPNKHWNMHFRRPYSTLPKVELHKMVSCVTYIFYVCWMHIRELIVEDRVREWKKDKKNTTSPLHTGYNFIYTEYRYTANKKLYTLFVAVTETQKNGKIYNRFDVIFFSVSIVPRLSVYQPASQQIVFK